MIESCTVEQCFEDPGAIALDLVANYKSVLCPSLGMLIILSRGPFLVSRYGALECSKLEGKGYNGSFISLKGVHTFRQFDGGHGSRNPLRSV